METGDDNNVLADETIVDTVRKPVYESASGIPVNDWVHLRTLDD